MPREYSDHPLCAQLMILKDEEALKDVAVTFGVSGRVERMSGFLLSLLSPVWRAKLCGEFSQGRKRWLDLEDIESEALKTVVELGCGGRGRVMTRGMEELLEVGQVAEFYQVDVVRRAVEEEAARHLRLETCSDVYTVCERIGLRQLEEACRQMALQRFEELTKTEGFMGMGEEMLRSLLEDDRLECRSEEGVFEGVVRWMRGGHGGGGTVRGEGLLDLIRFPVMRGDYLMTSARSALEGSERLERLVSDSEALAVKGLSAQERSNHVKYPGGNALRQGVPVGQGVRWGEYGEGQREARRLPALSGAIESLADCGDWVCGGHYNGTITVWNKANLVVERTLNGHGSTPRGHPTLPNYFFALAACEGWLVSASEDSAIMVWDVRGGQCVRKLHGHTSFVVALAVSEKMLLSGSFDETIRVWRLEGAPSTWRCEQTLHLHHEICHCVAWWESKAVSGYESGAIGVWDLSTGECALTMQGHTKYVWALVVREGRLISASADKSVREWCLESGACMKVVEAYPAESELYIRRLVVSGRKLVGGSWGKSLRRSLECEVVVWDLDTWAEEQRLKQPAVQYVKSLLALTGEVWAGVGNELVVWGREEYFDPPYIITATIPSPTLTPSSSGSSDGNNILK